jgi:hypothetical protein
MSEQERFIQIMTERLDDLTYRSEKYINAMNINDDIIYINIFSLLGSIGDEKLIQHFSTNEKIMNIQYWDSEKKKELIDQLIKNDNYIVAHHINKIFRVYTLQRLRERVFIVYAKYGLINKLNELVKFSDINYDILIIRLAFTEAAENGHIHILEWLKNKYSLTIQDVRKGNHSAFTRAEYNGHVHVLQWLKDNYGLTIDIVRYQTSPAYIRDIQLRTQYGLGRGFTTFKR